jgi:hypothetical protein
MNQNQAVNVNKSQLIKPYPHPDVLRLFMSNFINL